MTMQHTHPGGPRLHDAPPPADERAAPAAAVPSAHPRLTQALHWASALAVVLAGGAALAREFTEADVWRVLWLDVHRQAGLFVLLALGLRLAQRARAGLADHAGTQPAWQRVAAHGAHIALYGLLAALPLLGLAASHAHGASVRLFGLWTLPALVQADSDLADVLDAWHTNLAWTLLALVLLHVAAAWWHHAVRRDGVLTAMLPGLRRKP